VIRTVDPILTATVQQILERQPRANVAWDVTTWEILLETGIAGIGLPESRGGAGGTLADAAAVVALLAAAAVTVPVAETGLIASRLLEGTAHKPTALPVTVALFKMGTARAVPFGRAAAAVVALDVAEGGTLKIGLLGPGDYTVEEGTNLAGEPRDALILKRADLLEPAGSDLKQRYREAGALARSIQIAACAAAVRELTIQYVSQRHQFGSPLLRFQAVQQLVAGLAGEAYLAQAAVDAAIESPSAWSVAIAKAVCSRAATAIAKAAHQLHGAIGFTEEHDLHRLTKRLWAWRDEYGTEQFWSRRIGRLVRRRAHGTLWNVIVSAELS
jgi:acyl-CoA dehydrogenase